MDDYLSFLRKLFVSNEKNYGLIPLDFKITDHHTQAYWIQKLSYENAGIAVPRVKKYEHFVGETSQHAQHPMADYELWAVLRV